MAMGVIIRGLLMPASVFPTPPQVMLISWQRITSFARGKGAMAESTCKKPLAIRKNHHHNFVLFSF